MAGYGDGPFDPGGEDIDDLCCEVYREFLTYIMANPLGVDRANHLLRVAHSREWAPGRVIDPGERVS